MKCKNEDELMQCIHFEFSLDETVSILIICKPIPTSDA